MYAIAFPTCKNFYSISLYDVIPPIFISVDKTIDEHDIDQSLSLTIKLFLEESSNQAILPSILKEEPIFVDESNNAKPESLQTTDESMPQNIGYDLPPIVSQTQTRNNDSYEGSDDEEIPISTKQRISNGHVIQVTCS